MTSPSVLASSFLSWPPALNSFMVDCGYRTYFIEYSLNQSVAQQNEVGIFYGDIEIGDTAFNKSIDVNHAIPFPV